MPDQPVKGPPPKAPLSAVDADRLAESFTPIWEAADDPTATAVPPPVASVAAEPVSATAPPASPPALLGNAAISGGEAFQPPSTSAVLRPPSAAVAEPAPSSASPSAITQPLPIITIGASPPKVALPEPNRALPDADATEPAAEASAAPVKLESARRSSPAQQSSPAVPGYAIAYTPKDGPSTPAVVIAPEAQSSPENEQPGSTTIRTLARPAPSLSLPSAVQATAGAALSAPKKNTGRIIAVGLGALALLLSGVFVFRASLGAPALRRSEQPAARAVTLPAAAAPAATATVTPELSLPTATSVAPAPEPRPIEPEPAKAVPVAAKVRRERAKAEPVAATPARPKARPTGPPLSPLPVSPKPGSASTKSPGKGVIVRDAPF